MEGGTPIYDLWKGELPFTTYGKGNYHLRPMEGGTSICDLGRGNFHLRTMERRTSICDLWKGGTLIYDLWRGDSHLQPIEGGNLGGHSMNNKFILRNFKKKISKEKLERLTYS